MIKSKDFVFWSACPNELFIVHSLAGSMVVLLPYSETIYRIPTLQACLLTETRRASTREVAQYLYDLLVSRKKKKELAA